MARAPRRTQIALAIVLVVLLLSCGGAAAPAARDASATPTSAAASIAPASSTPSRAPAPSDHPVGLAAFSVVSLSDLSREAAGYLAGRSGRVGVAVLVPSRAEIYTNAAGGGEFHTASVIKTLIMMAVLRRAQDESRELTQGEAMLLQQMIVVSDNDAADVLWWELGGSEGVESFLRAVRLSGIEPDPEGYWGETLATPVAMAELYYLLISGQALGPKQTQAAVDLLTQVDPEQRWGVSAGSGEDAASEDVIGVKDGWYPDENGWWVNSVGLVVPADAKPVYTIAVMSDQQPNMEDARATIEGVSVRVHIALHGR